MDNINSKIGFNVSGAIASLQSLDAALGKYNSTLRSSVMDMRAFNKADQSTINLMRKTSQEAENLGRWLGATNGKFNASGSQINQLGLSLSAFNANMKSTTQGLQGFGSAAGAGLQNLGANQSLKQATKQVQSFTVSWGMMARIVSTQLLVRSLSAFRSELGESFQSAMDLEKRVSEIRAISPNESRKTIASDIVGLSTKYNAPLDDTAEAKYETISNQFVTAKQQSDLLNAAFTLSKVSASTAADSVMLLTGALNAYGKESGEAMNIAAQFDKTIELGRVRASELASSFSRVAPLANETGVSIEELNAGFIALTIGGVKASEAATQLRGVFGALLKPSQDMDAVIKSLGYESGAAMLYAEGFGGTLVKLRNATDGSANSLAKLFPNVRALNGALRITGSGLEQYTQGLEATQNVSSETLGKKLSEFMATDAEKLNAEITKIKNFFTTEMGESLIKSGAQVASWSGTLDTGVNALRTLLDVAKVAIPTLGGLAAVFLAMKANASMGGLQNMRAILNGAAQYSAASSTTTRNPITGLSTTNVTPGGFTGKSSGMQKLGAVAGIAGMAEAAYGIGDLLGRQIDSYITKSWEKEREIYAARKKAVEENAQLRVKAEETANHKVLQGLMQHTTEYGKQLNTLQTGYKDLASTQEAVAKAAMGRIDSEFRTIADGFDAIGKKARENIVTSQGRVKSLGAEKSDTQYEIDTLRFGRTRLRDSNTKRAATLADQALKEVGGATSEKDYSQGQETFKRSEQLLQENLQAAQQLKNKRRIAEAETALIALTNKKIEAEKKYQATQAGVAKKADSEKAKFDAYASRFDALKIDYDKNIRSTDSSGKALSESERQVNVGKAQEDAAKIAALIEEAKRATGKDLGTSDVWRELTLKLQQLKGSVDVQTITVAPQALKSLHDQLEAEVFKLNTQFNLNGKLAGSADTSRTEQVKQVEEATNAVSKAEIERNAAEAAARQAGDKVATELARRPIAGNTIAESLGLNMTPQASGNRDNYETWWQTVRQANSSSQLTPQVVESLKNASRSIDLEKIDYFNTSNMRQSMSNAMSGLADKAAASAKLKEADEAIKANYEKALTPAEKDQYRQTQPYETPTSRFKNEKPKLEDEVSAWYPQLLMPASAAKGESGQFTGIAGDVIINVTGGQTNSQTAREIVTALNRELRRGASSIKGLS